MKAKTFHIRHSKTNVEITLETEEPKFAALVKLVMAVMDHCLENGRLEEAQWLVACLEQRIETAAQR